MAHDRERHSQFYYSKLLQFSPIVGVFGHRQVGKSTFISKNVRKYLTFDTDEVALEVESQPTKFVNKFRNFPVALDECQIVPKLFPALKERVRIHKKPGQFVLSGSVRFTSRKAIRESLAGRMSFYEMLPFDLNELLSKPLSTILPTLNGHKIFSDNSLRALTPSSSFKLFSKHFENYLKHGGLPGICFIRDQKLAETRLQDLHSLILDRDLRLVIETKLSLATLKNYLTYLASQSFQPYNASEVKRLLKFSHETQKNLLHAFESIFLIRRLPILNSKNEIILLEDQFEEYTLSGGNISLEHQIESALYRNIRTQFMYEFGDHSTFNYFHTRNGARVPIVIKNNNGILGLISIKDETPTLSEKRSSDSFLKKFGNSKVLFLSSKNIKPALLSDRAILCSYYSVL